MDAAETRSIRDNELTGPHDCCPWIPRCTGPTACRATGDTPSPTHGVPIVAHLHGGHTEYQFDGNPEFFFSPGYGARSAVGMFERIHYKFSMKTTARRQPVVPRPRPGHYPVERLCRYWPAFISCATTIDTGQAGQPAGPAGLALRKGLCHPGPHVPGHRRAVLSRLPRRSVL